MNYQKIIKGNFRGIIDSTLREGLQFRNAEFAPAEQLRILEHLAAIGVEYAEVSNPLVPELFPIIKEMAAIEPGKRPRLLAHIRNNPKDMARAIESGVDGVNVLCTADPERVAALHISFQDYLKRLESLVGAAGKAGLEVRVSVEDIFHQDWGRIADVYILADGLGVARLGIPDTKGTASYWQIVERVGLVRKLVKADLEVHLHNDLGQAVGNAMAALFSGANWIDCTLCGIGERTGITPLSAMLLNLFMVSEDLAGRYELGGLTEAENFVAGLCRVQVPLNLPTNRDNGFAHKAGIHLDAIRQFGPQKYEFVPPGLIGGDRVLVTGSPISGKARFKDPAECAGVGREI